MAGNTVEIIVRVTADQAAEALQRVNAGLQGMGAQAEAEWKAALRLDPNYTNAYRLLAEYYLSARHWQKAKVKGPARSPASRSRFDLRLSNWSNFCC